ncbi:MAG TPA: twin-arginine translocase TatA/TatE family subunit [Acidimicrobiales bacterium]|nr:twin-arginine translocase TatA/TatE family subunit [Acidimicrobiales bacterium]
MLTLRPLNLLIVLVVAVILVGPDRLPQVAKQLGAAWRAFRQFHQRVEQEVRETIPDLPSSSEIARMARSPVAFLNQLADLPGDDAAVPDPAAEPGARTDVWPTDAAAAEGPPRTGGPTIPEPGSAERVGAMGTPPADPSMN